MHCICSPRSTRLLDSLYYLILCLLARPFLGLVGEAATPFKCLTPPPAQLASALGFLVLQGLYSNTLDI